MHPHLWLSQRRGCIRLQGSPHGLSGQPEDETAIDKTTYRYLQTKIKCHSPRLRLRRQSLTAAGLADYTRNLIHSRYKPHAIKEPQSRESYLFHRLNDRRKNLVRDDFIRVFGQTRFEALSPCHAQLGVDMDDVDSGRDRFTKILVVGSRTTVKRQWNNPWPF